MKTRAVCFRREPATLLRWDFSGAYLPVRAVRCTVCGGKWPVGDAAKHRRGCLEVEINGERAE